MEKTISKLVHVGKIFNEKGHQFLFLRMKDPHTFCWYEEENQEEREAPIQALNCEEAMRLAYKFWKAQSFRPLNCGFRYTLPERDEHGLNALFHQMAASYNSINGIYYDEELGNNCVVHNASIEARELLKDLKNKRRI